MTNSESGFHENADITASGADIASSGADESIDDPPESVDSESMLDPPSLGDDEDQGDPETVAATQHLCSIRDSIEKQLCQAASADAASLATVQNAKGPGVIGVGLSAGAIPGQTGLILYVESDGNEEEVRREVVDILGVKAASSDDLPVEVEVTGPVEASSTNRSKFRPAPLLVTSGLQPGPLVVGLVGCEETAPDET